MKTALIIGAGQAGLSLSYFLQKHAIDHLILEKDRPFSAWHARWDTFRLNTANWMNTLPGTTREFVPNAHPNHIPTKSDALAYFHRRNHDHAFSAAFA